MSTQSTHKRHNGPICGWKGITSTMRTNLIRIYKLNKAMAALIHITEWLMLILCIQVLTIGNLIKRFWLICFEKLKSIIRNQIDRCVFLCHVARNLNGFAEFGSFFILTIYTKLPIFRFGFSFACPTIIFEIIPDDSLQILNTTNFIVNIQLVWKCNYLCPDGLFAIHWAE